jgi:hypothetical protein
MSKDPTQQGDRDFQLPYLRSLVFQKMPRHMGILLPTLLFIFSQHGIDPFRPFFFFFFPLPISSPTQWSGMGTIGFVAFADNPLTTPTNRGHI